MISEIKGDTPLAVAAAVRDALIDGLSATVPGLGTFSVRHVASRIHTLDSGAHEMIPPRDIVEFEAAHKED